MPEVVTRGCIRDGRRIQSHTPICFCPPLSQQRILERPAWKISEQVFQLLQEIAVEQHGLSLNSLQNSVDDSNSVWDPFPPEPSKFRMMPVSQHSPIANRLQVVAGDMVAAVQDRPGSWRPRIIALRAAGGCCRKRTKPLGNLGRGGMIGMSRQDQARFHNGGTSSAIGILGGPAETSREPRSPVRTGCAPRRSGFRGSIHDHFELLQATETARSVC